MTTREEIEPAINEMREILEGVSPIRRRWDQDQAVLDRLLELVYLVKPLRRHMGDRVLWACGADDVLLWHEPLLNLVRRMQAFLKTNPDWEVPGEAAPPEPSGWVHPRLWTFIEGLVRLAIETSEPEQWDTVARQCSVFLESEIRKRTRFTSATHPGRKELATDSFKPGGPLVLGVNTSETTGWLEFVRGLLTGVGNPAAHNVVARAQPYAMGVAGSVSLVLTEMDERYGPPPA